MKRKFQHIAAMRGNLGVENHKSDTAQDARIAAMTPMQRLELVCGWHLGDRQWASTFVGWARDAGLKVEGDA